MGNCTIGGSDKANKIVMTNVNGDEGNWGMSVQPYHATRTALTPGAKLDAMNSVMVQNIAASTAPIQPRKECSDTETSLMHWLRHELTMAIANAIYDPLNL